MCCLQVTVCLVSVIHRQSVSEVIVRGLCDVCSNINSVTFLTDEQNAHSLCPVETPTHLFSVRIPRRSVWHRQPHMYPPNSVPSDVCCKIQASRLTTLVSNESRFSCSCTEILVFLTCSERKSRPTFCHDFSSSV
jgi:hypothetical protein